MCAAKRARESEEKSLLQFFQRQMRGTDFTGDRTVRGAGAGGVGVSICILSSFVSSVVVVVPLVIFPLTTAVAVTGAGTAADVVVVGVVVVPFCSTRLIPR